VMWGSRKARSVILNCVNPLMPDVHINILLYKSISEANRALSEFWIKIQCLQWWHRAAGYKSTTYKLFPDFTLKIEAVHAVS
jgi:hypothetical protein